MWLLTSTLDDNLLWLFSEAACLGASADADTDANADDDWGEDPEEEDGDDTGSSGCCSSGNVVVPII